MQQSIQCSFMTGALTDVPSIEVAFIILFITDSIYIITDLPSIITSSIMPGLMTIKICNVIINASIIFLIMQGLKTIIFLNIITIISIIFTLQGLMRCFEQQNASVHEILYYHKNSTGIWLEVIIVLIITIVVLN